MGKVLAGIIISGKAWLEETMGTNGAVIAGRATYEAARQSRWPSRRPSAT